MLNNLHKTKTHKFYPLAYYHNGYCSFEYEQEEYPKDRKSFMLSEIVRMESAYGYHSKGEYIRPRYHIEL